MSTVAKDHTYLCLKHGGCSWSCGVGRWSLRLESLLCRFTVRGLPKPEHTRPFSHHHQNTRGLEAAFHLSGAVTTGDRGEMGPKKGRSFLTVSDLEQKQN